MKKLLSIIFFMSFSIIFGLVLTSCDIESLDEDRDEQNTHVHLFSETYLYDETSHWQECTCGAKSTVIQHSFEEEDSNQELLNLRNEKKICRICQYEVMIDIPQEEHIHTYSEVWSSDESTHYHQATCEHSTEKKDIAEHTYGDWVILQEALENVSGLKKRECDVCGYEQFEQISALGHIHTFSEEWTIDKEPTCEETGSKSHHCLTCDAKTDYTIIPALDHSYTAWEVSIEPTLTTRGEITRVCTRDSNHIDSMDIPALNTDEYTHQITEEPTCESKGNEIYIFEIDNQRIIFSNSLDEVGHQIAEFWQKDFDSHWQICEVCNEIFSLETHQYDENYNCMVCSYIHNLGTPGLYYILTGDGSSYSVTNYFGMDTIIEIPEKYNNLPVSRIGEEVFANQSIVEVTLPSTIKKIGASAFDHCMKLSKINLPEGLVEIGSSAFNTCVNLSEMAIPDSVQIIGDSAFRACIALKELKLPDSLQTIGAYAFASCQDIETLTLPKHITTIGEMAFSSCFNLSRLEIPGTLKTINSSAFFRCQALESVVVEEGVEVISNNVFGECNSLKEIVLPKSLTHIQDGAFYMCEELMAIYYTGTKEEWSLLTEDGFNHYQCTPVIYTYSENRPVGIGTYWYYNEQNELVKW